MIWRGPVASHSFMPFECVYRFLKGFRRYKKVHEHFFGTIVILLKAFTQHVFEENCKCEAPEWIWVLKHTTNENGQRKSPMWRQKIRGDNQFRHSPVTLFGDLERLQIFHGRACLARHETMPIPVTAHRSSSPILLMWLFDIANF